MGGEFANVYFKTVCIAAHSHGAYPERVYLLFQLFFKICEIRIGILRIKRTHQGALGH